MEKLAELLTEMTRCLVDHPEGIVVVNNTATDDATTTFEVFVLKGDLGQALGKEGRLANAMRHIIKSAARKQGLGRVLVEFVEAKT